MFVTFEGLDGSGKTTQVELLRASLEASGREVVTTREPGGTELGEGVRELVLHGPAMTPWAEAALFAAARGELVAEVIRPALERGAFVVSDRYFDSSLAYQGAARELGLDAVLELNLAVVGGLEPDVTFLLLLSPEEAQRRAGDEPDRIEREWDSFRSAVDAGYREVAQRFPRRVVSLDGSLPPDELAEAVRARLGVVV